MQRLWILLIAFSAFSALPAIGDTTVLYGERVTSLDSVLADPNDLWIPARDLPRVNGFELKPEGACIDDICVPVRQDADSDMYVTRHKKGWINVTGLARKLEQGFAYDHEGAVWSFSEIPVRRTDFVRDHRAPDFALEDSEGRVVRLSAYRDRKVLMITWASW